jgi:hypothetical protein
MLTLGEYLETQKGAQKPLQLGSDVVPSFKIALRPNQIPLPWSGSCFQNFTGSVTLVNRTATIAVEAEEPVDAFCFDILLFATREDIYVHIYGFRGIHHRMITLQNDLQVLDVQEHGFQVFQADANILALIYDAWSAHRLVHSTKTAGEVREFLFTNADMKFKKRTNAETFVLDPAHIKSGDMLAVTRFDVSSMAIMWGTGGRTGHIAMFHWIEDVLYVLESIGTESGWPTAGVTKTPYTQWLEQADALNYLVSVFSLDAYVEEQQHRGHLVQEPSSGAVRTFNATASLEFFLTVEGNPYGTENFLMSWLDTSNGNFPPPVSYQAVVVTLPIVAATYPLEIDSLFTAAINKRLGTNNMTFNEIYRYLDDKNISLAEIIPIPEQDDWLYDGKPSLVCSALVMRLYKAGGLFDAEGLTEHIQGTEFTPRDGYSISLYNQDWQPPKGCDSPNRYDCQLMGDYVLELPGVNSIVPYANMMEKCSAIPPDYTRPIGC